MSDRHIQTSKFLSYLLRHDPEAIGLTMEPGGWVDVETLLARVNGTGRPLDRALLRRVVEGGKKQRFMLSSDGSKIRANYGHSVDVDLRLEPTRPPRCLYHGTAEDTVPNIEVDGLRSQSRQYVHLSSTLEEARTVGARHGRPVVLRIDAVALHEAGHEVYHPTDAVWLTIRVPPRFIESDSIG